MKFDRVGSSADKVTSPLSGSGHSARDMCRQLDRGASRQHKNHCLLLARHAEKSEKRCQP